MKKRKLFFACLLIVAALLSLTLAGCSTSSTTQADLPAPKPASEPAPAPSSGFSSELSAPANDSVTVYVFPPANWQDIYVWAWKDGGQDAFPAWPGIQATYNQQAQCVSASVPAWIDRLVISSYSGTVQTADLTVEAGRDVWLSVTEEEVYIYYENPLEGHPEIENVAPLYNAAQQGDYEAWKSLLPSIQDRSVLTNWVYNDFNYEYALECFQAGDYKTCAEFLSYCSYEDNQLYGQVIELLMQGDRETALDVIDSIGFTLMDDDLDMSWAEIIGKVTGFSETASELDLLLMEEYVSVRLSNHVPTLSEDTFLFGEGSSWDSPRYIGEITDTDFYPPVANFNTLKSQCGKEANGKVLVLRSQMAYPQGATYYAVDLYVMNYLSADLYPASLSEVEYILLVNYGYNVEGYYEQTFSNGSDVVDRCRFSYLRMKGQVQLLNVTNGQTVRTSPWLLGTGEVEAHFSDKDYQCSNMPETSSDIYHGVEKVRELNAAKK